MTKHIAVLIGSASKTSFNHLAVQHLQKIAPENLQLNIVEIGDLPLYDRDSDGIFAGAFDEKGELVSEAAKATLQGFIKAYAEFIAKF